jgi:hypothetical protein
MGTISFVVETAPGQGAVVLGNTDRSRDMREQTERTDLDAVS